MILGQLWLFEILESENSGAHYLLSTPVPFLPPLFLQGVHLCFHKGPSFASVPCFLSPCSPAGSHLPWLTSSTSVTF